ncbi:MAG TPA: type II secretion system F family protein, partial [Polyangia bacterium]
GRLMNEQMLFNLAVVCISSAIVIAITVLGSSRPEVPVSLGLRGWKRQQALEAGGFDVTVEPAVRLISSWIRVLPIAKLRAKADRHLAFAGDYKGLDADSWFARILLKVFIGAAGGAVLSVISDIPGVLAVGIAVAYGYSEYTEVDTALEERRRLIDRNLPGAIDLMSLCVSAGLGFPQAIRHIADVAVDQKDPVIEELRLILRLMDLGHTRAYALENFAMRVPIDSVRDFVGAVVQSESKGTPLKEVLATQAATLRDRRSTKAEEAAAKAGVKLTGPLAIMMMNMLLLIAGPMILKLMNDNTLK